MQETEADRMERIEWLEMTSDMRSTRTAKEQKQNRARTQNHLLANGLGFQS